MTERIQDGSIDPKLAQALEVSNYRVSLANQRKNARLKLNRFLTYPKNGGVFFVTPELISFVNTLIIHGKESTILLDTNENPIEITDLETFFEEVYDRYYQAMNDFLIEHKEIQKSRTIKKLVFEE